MQNAKVGKSIFISCVSFAKSANYFNHIICYGSVSSSSCALSSCVVTFMKDGSSHSLSWGFRPMAKCWKTYGNTTTNRYLKHCLNLIWKQSRRKFNYFEFFFSIRVAAELCNSFARIVGNYFPGYLRLLLSVYKRSMYQLHKTASIKIQNGKNNVCMLIFHHF